MPDFRRNPYRGLKTLKNELIPWGPFQDIGAPDDQVYNLDEVLRYLARQDERAYEKMEHQDAIVAAGMRRRRRTLLAAGWEIEPASASPAARLQADYCETLVKRLSKRWEVILDCMYYAIFWGWRPFERIWDMDATWRGKPAWFLRAIREKKPWEFRFTQARDLVYVAGQLSNQTDPIFRMDDDENRLRWLICTSGSSENPYGVADLRFVWLLKYCWSEAFKMLFQGTKRSMGLIEVQEGVPPSLNTLSAREQGGAGSVGQAKTVEAAGAEFAAALQVLDESGILISRAGYTMKLNADVKYAEGWRFPLEYLDRLKTLFLTGDTLSLSAGTTGSRAAAETKSRECEAYCIADGKELSGWVEQVFGDAIGQQFPDPDPDDAPRFRWNLGREVNLEAAQFYIDNGGRIDGKKFASKFGIPTITDEQPDDIVLEKAAPVLFGADGLPIPPGTDPSSPATPEDGKDDETKPGLAAARRLGRKPPADPKKESEAAAN